MNELRDIPAFDAYGDRLAAGRTRAASATERRVHRFGMAVFWTLALLIVAGRVHYGPVSESGPVMAQGTAPIEVAAR